MRCRECAGATTYCDDGVRIVSVLLGDPTSWYDSNAACVAAQYEAVDPGNLHAWLKGLLPPVPALVMDDGAGTGCDATELAGLGYMMIVSQQVVLEGLL